MDPGDAVAVNDRLATEFELLKNVDIFNWLEQNLDTISFWSISMFEPYLYLYFSLLPKSPVDALILIAVNVHDRVSIAGFSPHKGAIWNNQMCSKLMFIFRVAKTCQPCHYVKCSYHWANNSVNCTTSNVFRALMLVTPLLLGKGSKKKLKKKLTNVSFMYVCVAGNGEMLVFFVFSPNNSLIDNSLSE